MKLLLGLIVSPLILFLAFGCSKDNRPAAPATYYQGGLSVSNQSDVPIIIVQMIQKRGTREVRQQMGNALHPGFSLALHNIMDEGGGLVFPGGDKVSVIFASEQRDPNDPTQPLFQNDVQLTINGSLVIQVKSGGRYQIGGG